MVDRTNLYIFNNSVMNCALIAVLWIMFLPGMAFCSSPDPVSLADVYRARPFKPFVLMHSLGDEFGRTWDFSDGSMCGFTHFSGVENVKVFDGRLTFTINTKEAVLGWENYQGTQENGDKILFWPVRNAVRLRVRQSIGESDWDCTLWSEGKGDSPLRYFDVNSDSAHLAGSEWCDITFEGTQNGADGFELKIESIPGNRIEIDRVEIFRPEATGFFRRSFEIPANDQVWRCIGIIASGTSLYVNGRKIYSGASNIQDNIGAISLDLTPWLRNGKNCIGLTGSFQTSKNVFMYFQGQLVLESRERVSLDGVTDWKVSGRMEKGWNEPGFDDRKWASADAVIKGDDLWPRNNYTYQLYRSSLYPLAEYDSRIVYRNPGLKKLMYRSGKPVVIEVLFPAGLVDEKPKLNWKLRRVRKLEEQDAVEGRITRFSKRGNSIVFEIKPGRLEQATYTIESSLIVRGKVLEKRYREPFLVYGKTNQKEITGCFYEEGLDLKLESTIDFTDPGDPHPWLEKIGEERHSAMEAKEHLLKTARIVRENGLVYRETQSDRQQSFFSYRFEFKHPGDWYMLEIEYPNDKERTIGISISHPYNNRTGEPYKGIPRQNFFTDSGPGIMTGGHNPVSGKMQAFRWIHRAEAGEQTIDLLNITNGERAAAADVKIYHIKGNLPAVKLNASGERHIGIHNERPYHLGVNFGIEAPTPYDFYYKAKNVDFLGHYIFRLAWFNDVVEHYTQYLRFTGQNMHVMGAYQYWEDNWSYALPNRVESSSQVPCDIRDILLAYFDANGIESMSLVEFNQDKSLLQAMNRSDYEIAIGRDTTMPVMKDGRQSGWLQNFIHPLVEKSYLQIVNDLAYKHADRQGWKGVYLMPYPHRAGFGPAFCPLTSDPFDVGYSDATISAFEKDTGIEVPGEGVDRFMERYEFLTSASMKERWITWRAVRQRDIALKTRDELRKYRKDLRCILGNYIPRWRLESWSKAPDLSYHEINRLWGFDSTMWKDHDGLWYGRYMYVPLPRWRVDFFREHRTSPEVSEDYDRDMHRIVGIRDDWQERDLIMSADSDWPWHFNKSRTLPQNDLDHRKEFFSQAMAGNDPEIILYGFADVGQLVGQEQQLREIIREIIPLPGEKLSLLPGTGADKEIAIRAGKVDSSYYCYVVNSTYTPKQVNVILGGNCRIFELSTGKKMKANRDENGNTVLLVNLGAYEMKSLSMSDSSNVLSWSFQKKSDR